MIEPSNNGLDALSMVQPPESVMKDDKKKDKDKKKKKKKDKDKDREKGEKKKMKIKEVFGENI